MEKGLLFLPLSAWRQGGTFSHPTSFCNQLEPNPGGMPSQVLCQDLQRSTGLHSSGLRLENFHAQCALHTTMVFGRRATGGKLIATNATASTEARLSARGRIARRRAKTNMDTPTKLETGCLSKEQPFLDC